MTVTSLIGAYALALVVQGVPDASVEGTIRDAATGQPLPGAVVVLADIDRGTITDPEGRYELTGVPAGPQHMAVRRLGYTTRTLHLLVPRTGRLEFNVSLRAEPIPVPGLVVTPARPVRGADAGDSTAFPERGITIAALRNHPTLAQPDAFRALSGGEVVLDPEAAAGVHVRGGATDQTAYLLDGVPVLNPYHAAGLFSALNTDALEGLQLAAAGPSPALPEALSGVITARTREPGGRFGIQSALTNTEGRLTVDGPGGGAWGYLLSMRSGFPGSFAPNEASYLSGETGDLLAKVQAATPAGDVRVLLYDSENEILASRIVPDAAEPVGDADRNRFDWHSRSIGATWAWSEPEHDESEPRPRLAVRVGAWRATAATGSAWNALEGPTVLDSHRSDHGLQVTTERRAAGSASQAGLRLRRLATTYRVGPSSGEPVWDADGSIGVATLFAEHESAPGPALTVWTGASASLAGGSVRLAPRARVRWRPVPSLAWTLAYSRAHQFSQSLRNPESVVGHVFPADPTLAAGVGDVPVPRSDQLVGAGEWRPFAGVRLGVQAYTRRMEGLLLVAPGEREPFSTGGLTVGAARARGAAVDLAARGARYGVVAGYGWQRIRMEHGDSSYAPRHGAAHIVDAGVVLFPSATSSFRAGISAATGRHATAVAGPFEWEACNILDQGCEFAGSPRLDGPLGGSDLPAYVRLDLGARKHWHVRVGDRDILFGVFGTLTNVLGRRNTLVYVTDPETGERHGVEMLPRAPLVAGIDARF